MCAFVAVCRHPGGADEGAEDPGPQKAQKSQGRRRHRRLRSKCLIRCASISTRRRAAGDARCAGAAAGGRSASQRRARGVGRHRQDARAGRSLRAAARSRRRAAQHPGDHLHAQGRGRNAPARDGHAAAAPSRGQPAGRRAGARSATRSATSASARSMRSACRCCTSSRSKPASIPASTSPTKPRRRDSSKRRSTARWRSAAAISLDDPDVALLFTELGEPRLRKALTALLDRRLVARDALNRFLRGREMSDRRGLRTACSTRCAARSSSICRRRRRAVDAFIATGPDVPGLRSARARDARADGAIRRCRRRGCAALLDRLSDLVLTQAGRAAQAAGPHQGASSDRRPTTSGTR